MVRSRPRGENTIVPRISAFCFFFFFFSMGCDFCPGKNQLKSVFSTSCQDFALGVRPQPYMIAPLRIHISHLAVFMVLGGVSSYLF